MCCYHSLTATILDMGQTYRLRVKNKPDLLFAMMRALADDTARIAFEGRLAGTELFSMAGASHDETVVLRRNTIQPRLDFVVFPLTPASVSQLETAIRSKVAFNGQNGIVHVQIEKDGVVAFAAYDQFDDECVVVAAVRVELLDELVSNRVLHSYVAS